MKNDLLFQYCQKVVLFNKNLTAVLLARRKDEQDFEGTFSLIGGKLEKKDGGLIEGLRREKNEEIGRSSKVKICPFISYNIFYQKKDGSGMILPHYLGIYESGPIRLSSEYSEYAWVPIRNISAFEPKINTVPEAVDWAIRYLGILKDRDFVSL